MLNPNFKRIGATGVTTTKIERIGSGKMTTAPSLSFVGVPKPIELNESSMVVSEYGALDLTNIADYQIGKVLGQGAYAVVKEAQHRNSGFSIALKVYDKYKLVDV